MPENHENKAKGPLGNNVNKSVFKTFWNHFFRVTDIKVIALIGHQIKFFLPK